MKSIRITLLTTCLLIGCFINGYSQITFNKRYHFDYEALVFTGVETGVNRYYVTGVFRDTSFSHNPGNIWLQLDEWGNVIKQKVLKDTLTSYETWSNPLSRTSDGGSVTGGYSFRPRMHGMLIKYDEEGDTIFVQNYLHPNADSINNFISIEEVLPLPDSGFISLNYINRGFKGLIEVARLDPRGDLLWRKTYGDTSLHNQPYSIIRETDGGFIISAWQSNARNVTRNFRDWSYLIKIDSVGKVEWEFLWPHDSKHFAAYDVVKGIDGGWVVTTAITREEPINPDYGFLNINGSFFKINRFRQVEWEHKVNWPYEGVIENYFNRMIAVSDGSGYVSAGSLYSPNYVEIGQDITGWLYKISPKGDSLWSRRYQIISSRRDRHKFVDLKETSDGGFVMCGQVSDGANDTTRTEASQQGWLVKVDEYGCLVPGCQLATNTKPTAENKPEIRLYPNPVGDFLNIHIRDTNWQGRSFRLYDVNGRLLQQWHNTAADLTQMVTMDVYTSGWYVLTYWSDESELLWEGKVVKE